MTPHPAPPDQYTTELQQINRDLARLFDTAPAELCYGADLALNDALVICGLLGGKDVGKSTLINALAQTRVSADEREVGVGTDRPTAYVHADAADALRQRFHRLQGRASAIDVTMHRADPLRQLVLVDLPDFDSTFSEHERIVRDIAPLLDRIIWVVTPKKLGDREWAALLREIIKDPHNVHCVLNKVDELLSDGDGWDGRSQLPARFAAAAQAEPCLPPAEQVWRSIEAWVRDAAQLAGCPLDSSRLFLVAAAYSEPHAFVRRIAACWDDPDWQRYAADRPAIEQIAQRVGQQVRSLRTRVLSPIAPAEAEAIKAANRQRERQRNVERLRGHFDLDAWRVRLDAACDPAYYECVLSEALPDDYRAAVCARLERSCRSDVELADALLVERVEQWPILRVVYWPLSWFVRRIGRRVARAAASRPIRGDAFLIYGRGLVPRLRLALAQIRDDHARLIQRFAVESQVPPAERIAEQVAASGRDLVEQIDDRTLAQLREAYPRPAGWRRALLWLVLLWFPLVQPLAESFLAVAGADGVWMRLQGLHRLVAVLGAGPLLKGLALAIVIFVCCLAVMYARCIRAVRRARCRIDAPDPPGQTSLWLLDELNRLLLDETAAALAEPFTGIRRELVPRLQRLDALVDSTD